MDVLGVADLLVFIRFCELAGWLDCVGLLSG
jgi:hypothetical protein